LFNFFVFCHISTSCRDRPLLVVTWYAAASTITKHLAFPSTEQAARHLEDPSWISSSSSPGPDPQTAKEFHPATTESQPRRKSFPTDDAPGPTAILDNAADLLYSSFKSSLC